MSVSDDTHFTLLQDTADLQQTKITNQVINVRGLLSPRSRRVRSSWNRRMSNCLTIEPRSVTVLRHSGRSFRASFIKLLLQPVDFCFQCCDIAPLLASGKVVAGARAFSRLVRLLTCRTRGQLAIALYLGRATSHARCDGSTDTEQWCLDRHCSLARPGKPSTYDHFEQLLLEGEWLTWSDYELKETEGR